VRIFCVRIGDKYDIRYEEYLNKKIEDIGYKITWIREPFDDRVMLQWNKLQVMQTRIDEPVVVMDIDLLLTNNYRELIEYPINDDEFLLLPAWWNTSDKFAFNGGFQKFVPKNCNYIFKEFMSRPLYWQGYYIQEGMTIGPVNGEQFFVVEQARKQLKVKTIPDSWVCRWSSEEFINTVRNMSYEDYIRNENENYANICNGATLYDGVEFNTDVKLVHFTHTLNKPSEWKEYDSHR
jgi:hypothetical protein